MRGGVTSHPNVEKVLLVVSLGPRHVSTAKLTAENDLGLGDGPTRPLGKGLKQLPTVRRLVREQFVLALLGVTALVAIVALATATAFGL